jgi:VanZ family protein
VILDRRERVTWAERAAQGWILLQLPLVRRLVVALAVVGYALVSLWPFDWHPPERVANGAHVNRPADLSFPTPGLVRTAEPPAWIETAARTGRLDVTLGVRPLLTRQSGPARILSLSENGFERNLLIAQEGDDLVVDLRTPRVDEEPRDGEHLVRLRDVFLEGRSLVVAVTVARGELTVRAGEVSVRRVLAHDPLRSWDPTHHLAFGNGVTGNRPWLGEIEEAVVRTSGSVHTYPGAVPLEQPESFWILSREPKSQPLRHLQTRDTVNNLLLYLPLGLLLALSAPAGGRRAALGAVLSVAAISASMELAQFFISTRNPSINDLILNVAGGAVGYAVGLGVARQVECVSRARMTSVTTRAR